MFNEFKIREEFYNKYLEFYIERFVYTAIGIEKDQDLKERTLKKRNLLEAFSYSLEKTDSVLDVWDIRDVGNIINEDENVPKGFRKIQVSAGTKATFVPVRSYEILPRLYSLLDNYKNIWRDLNIFEKEAMFHIEFMRIHPFEDGNKRVAKTILNRNLLIQNMAPVIISEEDTLLYYKFINERDYIGFAKFLESRSANELTNMVALYKMLNNVPVDVEAATFLKREKIKDN